MKKEIFQTIIGCLFHADAYKIAEKTFHLLPDEAFTVYRGIYATIKDCWKQNHNIDPIWIISQASDEQERTVWKATIIEAAQTVVTLANYDEYLRIAFDEYRKQLVYESLASLSMGILNETTDLPEAKQQMKYLLQRETEFEAKISSKVGERFIDVAVEYIKNFYNPIQFINLGFSGLNHLLGGLERGTVVAISARAGNGKSAFALNLMLQFVKQGYKTNYYSMEMTNTQTLERIIANLMKIPTSDIRRRNLTEKQFSQMTNLLGCVDKSNDLNLVEGALTIEKLYADYENSRPDIVIIDHLGLMKTPRGKNRVEEIGKLSKAIKAFALEKKVVVIELVQMNRNIEHQNRAPVLSDLRECGDIEQDADNVIFLDPIRNENESVKEDEGFKVNLHIAKNRHGPVCKTEMMWFPQYCKYIELFRK